MEIAEGTVAGQGGGEGGGYEYQNATQRIFGYKHYLVHPQCKDPETAVRQVVTHTSQESFNEHSTLGFELAVEVAKDCPDHPKHNLEVSLLQCGLTGGVHQVLQLCDQQLAHPHQQRMLKGWYSPAVLYSVFACHC